MGFTSRNIMNFTKKDTNYSDSWLAWPYRATYKQYALHEIECLVYKQLQLE